MRPNARRTTLADIAQAAGVSVATVSKVVNGRGDVAPDTRTRVQELLHQHDYLAPVFRHTEAVESPTIEVQFQGGLKSYVAETLEGIIDSAAELGASVVISKASRAPHWARDLVSAGRRAVIAVTSVYTAGHLNELARAGLPLVVLDPLHLPDSRVNSVGATNFAGGLAATRHLLSLGHRRVAYLGGPAMAVCNQARMHGYRAAMEAEGVQVPPPTSGPESSRTRPGCSAPRCSWTWKSHRPRSSQATTRSPSGSSRPPAPEVCASPKT